VKVKVNKGGDTIRVSKADQLDALEQSLLQGRVHSNSPGAAQTSEAESNRSEPVDAINMHLDGRERNKRSLEDRSPEANAVSLQMCSTDSYQARSTERRALKQTKLNMAPNGTSNGGKTNQSQRHGQQTSGVAVSEYVEN